jgi:hypothetical protein
MRGRAGAAIAAIVSLAVPACETLAATPPPPAPASSPVLDATEAPGTPPACPLPPLPDPLVVAQVYRDPAAGCVPPRRLVAVRCSGLVDPVIVVGVRRRRPTVFLGGRFAVPTTAVPGEAAVLGVTATERVWWTPERELFVEGGGGTGRWLRLPPTGELRAHPSGWLIGDSILDGASDAVMEALPRWELSVDAEAGRTAAGGMAPAASAAASAPDVVVLELGTNDADPAAFRSAAGSMSEALADVPLVVWVVPRSPKVSTAAIGDALREVAAAHPNTTTADWAAEAPVDAFSADGVHLLPDRQDVFASFISGRLTAWARAVRGEGAAGCLGRLAEALGADAATGG